MQSARDNEIDRVIASGDYRATAQLAERRLGYKPQADGSLPAVTTRKGDVLDHLDAAEAWRMAGDADRAIAHYDAAEQALKGVELQNVVGQTLKQAGAGLGNDLVLDYVPSPAEAVLINYYKALAFWQKGDLDNVRVELNRADDRIRRAVERYQRELEAATEQAQRKEAFTPTDELVSNIELRFSQTEKWQPYASFVVPQASYLQALFLSRHGDSGDRTKAADLYLRVAGIVGEHPVLKAELEEASRGTVCPQNDCVWLLLEQGLGPVLQEQRFDLPVSNRSGMMIVSLALPMLKGRSSASAVPAVTLSAGSGEAAPVELASMSRVLQTEFDKRFPSIVTRAVIAGSLKAAMQHQINQEAGELAGLFGAVMSMAVTSADTRMWRSMPDRFYLARVHKSAGPVRVMTPQGPLPIELPATGSQLVHVKAPVAGIAPRYEVLPI